MHNWVALRRRRLRGIHRFQCIQQWVTLRLQPGIQGFQVYRVSKYTGFPSIQGFQAYMVSKHTGFPCIQGFQANRVSMNTVFPGIQGFQAYRVSKRTGFPSIQGFQAYRVSKYTGFPSIQGFQEKDQKAGSMCVRKDGAVKPKTTQSDRKDSPPE